jgi:hypothetical protein
MQFSIQCAPGSPSSGVKRLGLEAEYSPPSSAEVVSLVGIRYYTANSNDYTTSNGRLTDELERIWKEPVAP